MSPRATARQSASRSSAPPRERSTDARVTERNDQTIALGALSARDVARVGGKNASLGEMIQHMTAAGIRVPDGFATTASAFWDFVGENRLREPIAATLALPGGRGYRLDLGQPGQLRRGEGDRRAGGACRTLTASRQAARGPRHGEGRCPDGSSRRRSRRRRPGPVTDHPTVRHAGRRYFDPLLRVGVRVFEFQPRFLHAKTVRCDEWASIGSSNLDRWTPRWNLDANQEVDDAHFAREVEAMLEDDFRQSVELDPGRWHRRPWGSRALEYLAGAVDRWLAALRFSRRR